MIKRSETSSRTKRMLFPVTCGLVVHISFVFPWSIPVEQSLVCSCSAVQGTTVVTESSIFILAAASSSSLGASPDSKRPLSNVLCIGRFALVLGEGVVDVSRLCAVWGMQGKKKNRRHRAAAASAFCVLATSLAVLVRNNEIRRKLSVLLQIIEV